MRFTFLGFPVQVRPWFFAVAALLGLRRNQLDEILVWVGVVFVSVLLHELGHALMGRRYHLHPEILLYEMGGLTSWRTGRQLTRGQSILVSLAGPGAGLLLGAIVWAITLIDMPELNRLGDIALFDLKRVNIFWSLFNLLPILPLDGGNVMRSTVHIVRGRHDDRLPRQISMVTAGLGAVAALATGQTFVALFAAYLALSNYQALQGGAGPIFPGMGR